jgi:hypothetical protein
MINSPVVGPDHAPEHAKVIPGLLIQIAKEQICVLVSVLARPRSGSIVGF